MKLCECGCGRRLITSTTWNRRKNQPIRFIHGHNARGLLAHNWKGGKSIRREGYIMIRKNDGYIFEHVLIFEEHYRCCLLSSGIVHHIDGDRKNNNIKNLQGMTRRQHLIHHNPYSYYRSRKNRNYVNHTLSLCSICGSPNTIIKKNCDGIKKNPIWYISDKSSGKYICHRCYDKQRYMH